MKREHRLTVFHLCAVLLLAALAGCQGISRDITAIFARPTEVFIPRPTRAAPTLEPLPATYTPDTRLPSPTPTPQPARPVPPPLISDFPLVEGAQIVPEETRGDADRAAMLLHAGKSPGELAALYRQALEERGWTLRYTEGNAVGGFVQEWKKDRLLMTVEYHFRDGRPAVSVDARLVDSNRALALLLGFPLPNGSEVLDARGSAIELYVPLDLKTTVDFFKKQIVAERWRLEKIKPTGWCGSRGCQEASQGAFKAPANLEPTPTPDKRAAEYYRATMPDFTEAEITFLPQRDHTRVYIQIHFLDLRRSYIPVALYPRATITAIQAGVAMFETADPLKDVIKFYEGELAGLGWEPLEFSINQPDRYSRSWGRKPNRAVSLTLSVEKGVVYGQLTCSTCIDPYFVIPSSTPSPAPSR
jgi:hypothetical protein